MYNQLVIGSIPVGLPAVITIGCYFYDLTTDDVPIPQALRQLEELGADVVGVNCGRGPDSMMPLLKKCREVCKVFYEFSLVSSLSRRERERERERGGGGMVCVCVCVCVCV